LRVETARLKSSTSFSYSFTPSISYLCSSFLVLSPASSYNFYLQFSIVSTALEDEIDADFVSLLPI